MPQNALTRLQGLLRRNKAAIPEGIFSVCSSHQTVLESTFAYAAGNDTPLLIESTSNQVNQFGGYTGITPAQFSAKIRDLALKYGISPSRLILGGDHLGPYPWRDLPSLTAMDHACRLVRDCAVARYGKIHLDASMHLADDNPAEPLAITVSAERTAALCQAAERTIPPDHPHPFYVIGSEVPAPGGEQTPGKVEVTDIANLTETIRATQQAFMKKGLNEAWERVIALVVQPGVEFYHQGIHTYQPGRAAKLSVFIRRYPGLVYEAHSTDYQTLQALKEMVRDHFAILKVGPELTFAYREMVFALEMIEMQLSRSQSQIEISRVSSIIDQVMLDNPEYWANYYTGSAEDQQFARKWSYLDRIRYYWTQPKVAAAVEKLINNLTGVNIPAALLNDYLPFQVSSIQDPAVPGNPRDWIDLHLRAVLDKYHRAVTPDPD